MLSPQSREQRPLDRGSPSSLPSRIRTVTLIKPYELAPSELPLHPEICGTRNEQASGRLAFRPVSPNPGGLQQQVE